MNEQTTEREDDTDKIYIQSLMRYKMNDCTLLKRMNGSIVKIGGAIFKVQFKCGVEHEGMTVVAQLHSTQRHLKSLARHSGDVEEEKSNVDDDKN